MTTWAMVDLETLDTRPEGQILTIGGVKFDPFNSKDPFDEFYYRFNIDEQEQLGRTVSESTLEWWGRQDDEIIEEAFGPDNRTDCTDIMKALKKWYVGCDRIWSQGEMDTVMLEHMCHQLDQPVPWPFWCVENLRTLLNRMPRDPRKDIEFAAHNALEDCKGQVYALRKAFEHFDMKK